MRPCGDYHDDCPTLHALHYCMAGGQMVEVSPHLPLQERATLQVKRMTPHL